MVIYFFKLTFHFIFFRNKKSICFLSKFPHLADHQHLFDSLLREDKRQEEIKSPSP